jgi:multiple sugar transport system ATP-binding protein
MGIVQQVGAPLELYANPANTFVAGFIGSPSMNFFECEVVDEGGAPTMKGKGFSIPVPERFHPKLDGTTELILGVRPEHLSEATDGKGHVPGTVEVLEPLGSEVHALGNVEGQAMTAKLEPTTQVNVGDTVPLAMDLSHIHLFDRSSGLSVMQR